LVRLQRQVLGQGHPHDRGHRGQTQRRSRGHRVRDVHAEIAGVGRGATSRSRTRMNLLINGLITGAVFAIAASGLVVTYSTSGVFNFAHGALGMLCAYVYWDLRVNED